jgi:four helix bundle protein
MIYKETQAFPKTEIYGLTSQIRRAAVSIPSNIAESFGRRTKPDFLRFLYIARGSLYELQTQVEIAVELCFIPYDIGKDIIKQCTEVEMLLNGLIHGIKSKIQ